MRIWKHWLQSLWLVVLALAAPVLGQERLLSFHSAIVINADASLQVTERIRFHAEGREIRKGLYRDFPTDYRDRLGNRYRVRFDIVDIKQDGSAVWWQQERRNNGVRLVIGDSFLKVPGDYEYTITYRTSRQLGFFEDHDELYWNVTGLGWSFVIDEASAIVTLPQQVAAAQLKMEGYTGAYGGRGQDYMAAVSDGRGEIHTTSVLPAGSGLTLALSWPKGLVQQPTPAERASEVVKDNSGLLGALLVLIANIVYLGAAWLKVGRDPPPGVIFPHYEAPKGITPASARFVRQMRYDGKALTAAIVDLAVQGFVHITQVSDKYTLERRKPNRVLAPDEQCLLDKLFAKGELVELDDKNHAVIGAALAAHHSSVVDANMGKYVLSNGKYLLPSLLGSAVAFVLVFVFAEVVPLVVVSLVIIAVLHILFVFLLKAPTTAGRLLLDKLEGFRLYLDVAEKDEMNLLNPPELTPVLFESFLPYAIALGVEERWGERFASKLASLQGQQHEKDYYPSWYSGSFHAASIGTFTHSLGSSVTSAISASATPPGSSSGSSGGGFSGGGGGGGGGGGH